MPFNIPVRTDIAISLAAESLTTATLGRSGTTCGAVYAMYVPVKLIV